MNFLMLGDNLRKEHLADSDHATPSSIADVRAVDFVWQFGKAGAVGEPWSGSEYLVDLFGDLGYIILFGEEGVSKDVDLVSFLEEGFFFVFFQVAEKMIPEVEGQVFDAFSDGRCSKRHKNNYKK